MWGLWGPWAVPTWGFWWVFPLIVLCMMLGCVIMMARSMGRSGGFMCMGRHGVPEDTDVAQLRREVRELREELKH